MKYCLSCDINIGGNIDTCPVCQNSLTGEAGPDNWAPMNKLKKQALLYKIQLFIILASVVVALSLDFLLDLNNEVQHWSLLVAVGLITFELILVKMLKKRPFPAKIFNICILHLSMMLLLISWYYKFMDPVVNYVIPITMGVTVVTNFVFALIDKAENAMVYLLANIIVGLFAYGMTLIVGKNKTVPWTICLILSVVMFIGIVVFKGRKVWLEVQKRMNF